MSNFMHKVKDAFNGHLHPQNKGSQNDPSKMENRVNVDDPSDTSRPSNMGGTMEGSDNTYGATTAGTTNYDSATRDPTMRDTMKTSDNYGSSGLPDSTRMASGMNDTTRSYGSTRAGMDNMGSVDPYRDTTMGQNIEPGGYGSGNMNTGSRLNESKMANEMNAPADTSLGNRGTYGGTTTSTTDPAGQFGGYGSNYGAVGGNTMDSGDNTYNTGFTNMANQIENRSDQQDFGGAAAGGSSYNAPKASGRRRSSGPHSSNLLNKLDPRVHRSDYEDTTAINQRGN